VALDVRRPLPLAAAAGVVEALDDSGPDTVRVSADRERQDRRIVNSRIELS
jgi:hypothetical protein